MYNPDGDEASGEWVELYVQSGGIDLGGYVLTDQDNHNFTFPSFTQNTGEYVVVYTGNGTNDLTGPVYHLFRGSGVTFWNNDGDDVTLQRGSPAECMDYMAFESGSADGASWGAHYGHEDLDVTFGATYFYKREVMDIFGESIFHDPVEAQAAAGLCFIRVIGE